MLDPIMPAGARVGQSDCRADAGISLGLRKVQEFPGGCNHLHVDLAYAKGPEHRRLIDTYVSTARGEEHQVIDPQPVAPPLPFLIELHGIAFWLFVVAFIIAAVALVVALPSRKQSDEGIRGGVVAGRVALWAGVVCLLAGVLALVLPSAIPI